MHLNATLIVQFVVFVVAGWVTMQFIWPLLSNMLDERRQKIADGLAAGEQGKQSLTEARRQVAQIEADAKARAQQIILDTEKRAQVIVEDAKAHAQQEGERLVAMAKAEAEQQMVRVKTLLRDRVAELAVTGAEEILKREVDAKTHAQLLDQLKQQL
jgi:F-type H+-transporting ATPase subunit b